MDITYSFENFHNLILKKINLIASMLVNSSVISLLIIVRRVIKTTFLKKKKKNDHSEMNDLNHETLFKTPGRSSIYIMETYKKIKINKKTWVNYKVGPYHLHHISI